MSHGGLVYAFSSTMEALLSTSRAASAGAALVAHSVDMGGAHLFVGDNSKNLVEGLCAAVTHLDHGRGLIFTFRDDDVRRHFSSDLVYTIVTIVTLIKRPRRAH